MWINGLLLTEDPLTHLGQCLGMLYSLVMLPFFKATYHNMLMLVCVFIVSLHPYSTYLGCLQGNNLTKACLSQHGVNMTELAVDLSRSVDDSVWQMYVGFYKGWAHAEL
ncbi:MAG: hypothetical protein ACOYL3_26530 [Desulfuromonadaceae bacterium]